MSQAKIRLSQKEMELVSSGDLILTKNAILQKANHLFSGLQEKELQYLEYFAAQYSDKLFHSSAKISKGENYKGLPYLILDYPRVFEQEHILAIRTMFWWGNFFSSTLHLSGRYKIEKEEKLINAFTELKEKGYYLNINEDPWEHHFEADNYIPVAEISNVEFENSIRKNNFVKLANKIDLQQWEDAEEILLGSFKRLITLLTE